MTLRPAALGAYGLRKSPFFCACGAGKGVRAALRVCVLNPKSCAFTASNSPLTARNCCCKSAAEGPATSPAPGNGRGGGGSTGPEAGGWGCGASFKNFAMTPCMPGSAARFTVPGATASSATQTCVSACSVCTCGARLVRRDSNTAQPATGHTTGSTLRVDAPLSCALVKRRSAHAPGGDSDTAIRDSSATDCAAPVNSR